MLEKLGIKNMRIEELKKLCEKHVDDLIDTNHSPYYIESNVYVKFGSKLGLDYIKKLLESKLALP